MSDHEPSPTEGRRVSTRVDIHTLHGLNALIHWIKGYESAGNGRIPGGFDLVMLYRTMW